MHGHVWSSDQIDELRRLWAGGATAEAIGEHLGGLSRSAVLGKIFRLRLDQDRPDSAPTTDAVAHAAKPVRRRRSPRRKTPPPRPVVKTRLGVLDLENCHCRWPIGRPGAGRVFFFCAKPEADVSRGIPYCPQHMRRAYDVLPGTAIDKAVGRSKPDPVVSTGSAGVAVLRKT
jgi:GcrA cell cycle regulator